ncbi:MAG: hypothetical protein LBL56_03455 [Treponema sp.]|jgi:hypothetical protein|nr:hypothetical protein [Treponema sp.]
MTIEQTVEIPADHRLTIEVPPEIPTGRAKAAITLIFETETPEPMPGKRVNPLPGLAKGPGLSIEEALETGRGIAKRMGSRLTGDLSIEWRHEDKELEETKYQRIFQKKGDKA